MATRVAVMAMGKLQQVGTPKEVYDKPINTFVAQFIGTPPMNCLAATISTDGNRIEVAGAGTLPLPAGLQARVEPGQATVVGVRPEHLLANDAGSLVAKVRAVEWLGHECLVSVEVDGQLVTLREPGLATYEVGTDLRLSVAATEVHLFDSDTTERLS